VKKEKSPDFSENPAQVERAKRLHLAIAEVKSGKAKSSETPRDFTEKAASEAARKYRKGIR